MAANQKRAAKTRVSYCQIFRLIFVLFSIYLLKEFFYHWDGFRHYATFTEFLPNIALLTICWVIVAIIIALIIWLLLKTFEWFCLRIGWTVKIEHLLMYTGIVVLLGAAVWITKRYIWPHVPTTLHLKLAVLLCVAFAAVFITWLFRNRAERWIGIIQERITPLVWLFGIWVILSVPLVAYHTWIKQEDNVVISQKIPKASSADKSRPNIILVTFDALTARDMSVYGYHRPTTPFISKWAKTASLFTKVEAESNYTTPTTASLISGKRVWSHRTYHIRGSHPVRSDIESLPVVLKNNGYYNMAFVVNTLASVNALGVSNSFDIAPLATEFVVPASLFGWDNVKYSVIDTILYRIFGGKIKYYDWILKRDSFLTKLMKKVSQDFSKTTVPPKKALNRFLEIIDENPPEPFFAWIHLFPPHDPYLPPELHMGIFDSSHELKTFKKQKDAFLNIFGTLEEYQHFTQEIQPTVDTLRTRYDEFIKYCDKQFEEFIEELAKRDMLENTVIILSSDHGESFQHDYIMHGGEYLYEQVTHIPFIIKEPHQKKGRIVSDLIEQIDIPATILDLANIPIPSWMEGRSLVPLMRGKMLPRRPAFSMNLEGNFSLGHHQITKGTIAVWEGNYKLIHYLEEGESLLFNLRDDPGELNNLFDKESEIGQRLLGFIKENLKKANERISRTD